MKNTSVEHINTKLEDYNAVENNTKLEDSDINTPVKEDINQEDNTQDNTQEFAGSLARLKKKIKKDFSQWTETRTKNIRRLSLAMNAFSPGKASSRLSPESSTDSQRSSRPPLDTGSPPPTPPPQPVPKTRPSPMSRRMPFSLYCEYMDQEFPPVEEKPITREIARNPKQEKRRHLLEMYGSHPKPKRRPPPVEISAPTRCCVSARSAWRPGELTPRERGSFVFPPTPVCSDQIDPARRTWGIPHRVSPNLRWAKVRVPRAKKAVMASRRRATMKKKMSGKLVKAITVDDIIKSLTRVDSDDESNPDDNAKNHAPMTEENAEILEAFVLSGYNKHQLQRQYAFGDVQMKYCEDTFRAVDVDESGYLSFEEFQELVNMIQQEESDGKPSAHLKAQLTDWWFSVDHATENQLSFAEFVNWYASHAFDETLWLSSDKLITRLIAKGLGVSILDVERMKVKFDKFDTDCSGSIEFDEFDHLLRDVLQVPKDLHLSPDRVRFFWGDINPDGDEGIDFVEFLGWYRKYFPLSAGRANTQTAISSIRAFYQKVRPPLGKATVAQYVTAD